jgi:hypothetical protein
MRRKRYLIEPTVQLKIIGILAFVALAAAVNICVLVYYHQEKIVNIVGNSGLPPAIIAQQLHEMNLALIYKLAATVAGMVALFMIIGSWITNRIAGPLFKLRNVLRAHFNGETIKDVTFRKDDEFRDVFEMISKLISQARP